METQCNGMLFDFQGQNRRDVVATFDGGALLLREVERLTGIISGFSKTRDRGAVEKVD